MSEKEKGINEQKESLEEKVGSKFCSECGEEIVSGHKFCHKCGKAIDEKLQKAKKPLINKKQFYIIGGIVLCIIIGIFTNSYIKEQKQKEARYNYLSNVKEFYKEIIIAGANVEDIADTIQNYWNEYIFEKKHGSSIDSAVFSAMSDKSEEIEQAEKDSKQILELYRKIKVVPEGSEDLNEYINLIDNVYNSYTDFYSIAIEPTGNFTQYANSNNEKTDKFLSDYRTLTNLIESNKELQEVKTESEIIMEKMNSVMKEYNSISESMDITSTGLEVSDEEIKDIVPDMINKKEVDVRDIEKQKEKFKDNEKISNAISIVLNSKNSYNEMIKYSKRYSNSKSQNDLKKFKSAVLEFRGEVAMYLIQVDSLDDDGESLTDKLK